MAGGRARLVAEKQSSQAGNRLEEIELRIAEQRLGIAKADLDETSRFPPGTITENEYQQLREGTREAKLRLDGVISGRGRSTLRYQSTDRADTLRSSASPSSAPSPRTSGVFA